MATVKEQFLLDSAEEHSALIDHGVVSFETNLMSNPSEGQIKLEPEQYFNGYDKPWPPGGGDNIADFVYNMGVNTSGGTEIAYGRAATVRPIKIESGKNYYIKAIGENPRGIIAVWNGETLIRRESRIQLNTALDVSGGTDLYVGVYENETGKYLKGIKENQLMVVTDNNINTYTPYSNACPIAGHEGISGIDTGTDVTELNFPYDNYNHYWVGGTGKNLLDEATLEQGGMTESGPQSNGSRIRTSFIYVGSKVSPSKIFTINAKKKSNLSGTLQASISFYASNAVDQYTHRISVVSFSDVPVTFTVPSNATYCIIAFGLSSSAMFTPADVSSVQLEAGWDATIYEPYENMPYWAEGYGKNLLDVTQNEEGGIDASGIEVTGNVYWRGSQYIPIKPNTSYSFSSDKKWTLRLYWYDANKQFISPRIQQGYGTPACGTSPSNAAYARWSVYKNQEAFTKEEIESVKFQLEEGLSVTSYEPYEKRPYWLAGHGKNLFNGTFLQGFWAEADGAWNGATTWIATQKIRCKPSTKYTASSDEKITRWQGFGWYDANDTFISFVSDQSDKNIGYTATSPSNAAYLIFNIAGYPTFTDNISPSEVTHFQIEEGLVASAYEPYENMPSGADFNGYADYWVGGGGKNLLNYSGVEKQIVNGITFTVSRDLDGNVTSIVANGTATGSANYYFSVNSVKSFGGCILTGCPLGGSSSTYRMEYYDNDTITSYFDYGSGLTIPEATNGHVCRVICGVRTGYTANNLIFRPMIRKASETNPAWLPYENRKKRKKLLNITPSQNFNGYDRAWIGNTFYNMLPMVLSNIKAINYAGTWNGNNYTLAGVTYTINVDEGGNVVGVTANGKSTGVSLLRLVNELTIDYNCLLTGCPAGGAYEGFRLQADAPNYVAYQQIGDHGRVIPGGTELTRVVIWVPNGVEVSNAVFYPRIRPQTFTDEAFKPYTNYSPIHPGAVYEKDDGTKIDIYGGTYNPITRQLVSKMACKKLSEITWEYQAAYTRFNGVLSPEINNTTGSPRKTSFMSSSYEVIADNRNISSVPDGGIYIGTGTSIHIHDAAYTTSEDLIANMGDQTVCYELKTPVTYTLSKTESIKLLASMNLGFKQFDIQWKDLGGTGKNLLNINRTAGTPNPNDTQSTPRVMDTEHYFAGMTRNNYYVPVNVSNISIGETNVRFESAGGGYGIAFPISVKPSTDYAVSFNNVSNGKISIGYYDENWEYLSAKDGVAPPYTFQTPENCKYASIVIVSDSSGTVEVNNVQIEEGSAATSFAPYKVGTVGEALIDLSEKKLIVYSRIIDLGTLDWTRPTTTNTTDIYRMRGRGLKNVIEEPAPSVATSAICSIYNAIAADKTYRCQSGIAIDAAGDLEIYDPNYNSNTSTTDFANFVSGQTLVYPLAEPNEYSLTDAQVRTLIGNNNLWTDVGEIDSYKYYSMKEDSESKWKYDRALELRRRAIIAAAPKLYTEEVEDSGIVSFQTDMTAPIKSLKTDLNYVQDLHGYDTPWTAGAGKNKILTTLEGLKAANTSGLWTGNSYTANDVIFTILTDNDENVIGIKANGTATGTIVFQASDNMAGIFQQGDLLRLDGITGGDASTYKLDWYIVKQDSTTSVIVTTYSGPNNVTISENAQNATQSYIRIVVYSGAVLTDQMFYPMIKLQSDTSTTFIPSTNTCSIKSWTEENVRKNILRPDGTTNTNSGVTFTKLSDGSWMTSGTAANLVAWPVGSFDIEAGKTYILSGCPRDGGTNNYRLDVREVPGAIYNGIYDNGNISQYATFTATENKTLRVYIRIANGFTADGLFFKPMVRLARKIETNIGYVQYDNDINALMLNRPGYIPKLVRDGIYDASGEDAINPARLKTDYIPISVMGRTSNIIGAIIDETKDLYFRCFYWYRADKTFIGNSSAYTGPLPIRVSKADIPAAAEYFRFVLQHRDGSTQFPVDTSGYVVAIMAPANSNVNLLNQDGTDTKNGYVLKSYINTSGTVSQAEGTWNVMEYTPVEPNTTYTLSGTTTNGSNGWAEYDSNKEQVAHGTASTSPFTFTTGPNTHYVRFNRKYETDNQAQINLGTSALPYEPYVAEASFFGIKSANIWDEQWESGDIAAETGENIGDNALIRSKNYIRVYGGCTYFAKFGNLSTADNVRARFYDKTKTYIGYSDKSGNLVKSNSEFTVPNNAYYMRFAAHSNYGSTYNNDISINYPSTITKYNPYLSDPIYGATINLVTGKLAVDRACKAVIGGQLADYKSFAGAVGYNASSAMFSDADFNKPIVCNKLETIGPSQTQHYGACKWSGISFYFWFNNGAFTDFTDAVNKTNAAELQCCYYLKNPITYQLNPQQIDAFLGSNSIIIDSYGDTEVKFWSRRNLDVLDMNNIVDSALVGLAKIG